MSKLAFFSRPWVAFDAGNKQHRRYYAEFQQTGTWGRCPVRFIVPDDVGDLVTMIQRRLIDFYLHKEFKPTGLEKGGDDLSHLLNNVGEPAWETVGGDKIRVLR